MCANDARRCRCRVLYWATKTRKGGELTLLHVAYWRLFSGKTALETHYANAELEWLERITIGIRRQWSVDREMRGIGKAAAEAKVSTAVEDRPESGAKVPDGGQ